MEPILLTHAKPGTPEYDRATAGKITASLAASILCPGEPGVHGTPLEAWAKIKAKLEASEESEEEDEGFDDEPEDDDMLTEQSPKAALEWGLATEELHAQLLMRHAGLAITTGLGTYADAEMPWLAATPDGLVMADGTETGTLELKAPTDYGMRKWVGGAPIGYIAQAQVQMRVMRATWGVVSALIPPKPQWERVYASPEMEEWILTGLTAFYENHVVRDIPPPATGSDKDLRAMRALFKKHEPGKRIVFSAQAIAAAADLEEAKAEVKRWTAIKKTAQALLMSELGDAEAGILPGGEGYTYKSSVREMKARAASTIQVRALRRVKSL